PIDRGLPILTDLGVTRPLPLISARPSRWLDSIPHRDADPPRRKSRGLLGEGNAMLMTAGRQPFGIEGLDRHLGGGPWPGPLPVMAGPAGAGTPQLGLRWPSAGRGAEGRRGVICALTSRGDAQKHPLSARPQFAWDLSAFPAAPPFDLPAVWDFDRHL